MPDISDDNWSERDDRNAENVPDGWPPGLPAFIELVGRMMMGAVKRFWNKANPVYLTRGAADAYVVTTEAKVAFINIYEIVRIRINRANTTTAPTLQWGDAAPRTIVKVLGTGVTALAIGDLIAGRDHSFWYNGTNFVLSNPGTVSAAETSGLLKSANNLSDVLNASTSLTNIGGMAKATYDPQNINGDAFSRANQTGTQAQSTIVNLVSDLALKAPLASPPFTGTPTAPTAAPGTSTTQLATTAFVGAAVTAALSLSTNCELAFSSPNLLLRRKNGATLAINGVNQTIPSAGVTLAATGLTVSTLYYVYAFMNAGTMTLEASTTAYAIDTTTGLAIKNGDATRTLVGMARPVTGPAWSDATNRRFVRSWYNTPATALFANFTADRTTASTTFVEINSEIRCEFLIWSGEALQGFGVGSVSNNTAAAAAFTSLGIDGTTPEISGSSSSWANANNSGSFSAPVTRGDLSEGYHYVTLIGAVSTGTGSWVGASAGLRSSISGTLKR